MSPSKALTIFALCSLAAATWTSSKRFKPAVWMHFLCTASSPDAENAEWLKSAAVLKWSTPTANRQTPNNQDKRHANGPVTLICFRPMEGICERIFHLAQESNWGDVLQDPYLLLLDMVYESWYLRLDESAWKTNNLCQNIEKDAFKGTRDLDASFPGPPVVDIYYVHTIAKNAIFMLEAVDATLRSLDAAIAHHQELSYTISPPQKNKKEENRKILHLVNGTSDKRSPIWRATQGMLLHRRELFQATRLRTISVEKRLTNIINLAFNIDAMRNSRITQRDSYSLKALSLVATVFLPISTVATVFSTPFFEASGPSTSPQASDVQGGGTLLVNSKFWLLWAVSMPISVALIFGWWFWVKGVDAGSRTRRIREKDVEKG
ncbi:uncharacterized protein ARB_01102 [Trichophyton benhamiae CBS 112371]|uniref:CorA-like Mg2+ transporter protein n=1 Tax=Arthroderma benhamiae (strain ATCC MYA-4681 / CBS 112371) TaxID=663331 RepID=D4AY33_ARTBC|nr:uncharacterized protein ARB_01102 [Trichophyton benhamiae CBS 112371]EFE32211.1 hypothetical protein ARB_01102 [Trichophyton benhamiae CBS 112371]